MTLFNGNAITFSSCWKFFSGFVQSPTLKTKHSGALCAWLSVSLASVLVLVSHRAPRHSLLLHIFNVCCSTERLRNTKRILPHPKPLVFRMDHAPVAFPSIFFFFCPSLFPLSNAPAVSYLPHPLDFLDSTQCQKAP